MIPLPGTLNFPKIINDIDILFNNSANFSRPTELNSINSAWTGDILTEIFEAILFDDWRKSEVQVCKPSGNLEQSNYFKTVPVCSGNGSVDLVDTNRLEQYYQQGYNIIFKNLQNRSHTLRLLRKYLEAKLHCYVDCQVFMSKNGEFAFAKHSDDHDVVSITLRGSKQWSVYSKSRNHNQLLKTKVERGSFIFVSRHFPHHTLSLKDDTVHLSIGIFSLDTPTLNDLDRNITQHWNNFSNSFSTFSPNAIYRIGPQKNIEIKKISVSVSLLVFNGRQLKIPAKVGHELTKIIKDGLINTKYLSQAARGFAQVLFRDGVILRKPIYRYYSEPL